MRTAVWILLGSLMSVPAFAGTWASLWRTPDQQGQALLEAGQAAKAAARFTDPRLKAYADLEAGRYSAAATLLAPFKDATSEYNRGNALAHAGHLRQALGAYDAALKQAPRDRDIRHNRDLVARMLRQHPPQSAPKGGGQGKPRGGSQGANQTSGQGPTGSRNGQNKGQSQGNGQNQSQGQGKPGQSGAAGHQGKGSGASGSQSGSGSGHGAPSAASRSGTGARQSGQGARAAPRPIAGAGASQHNPGQARRDAALAAAIARHQKPLGAQAPGPAPQAGAPGAQQPSHARPGSSQVGGGTYTPGPRHVSEKTLALEQWLRQIPDNPAGLLRRKFLIQYMMRHPGENP